jgi:hypothetical protein
MIQPIESMTYTVVTRGGRPYTLWSDGTLLPVVAGGDGSGDEGGDGGQGAIAPQRVGDTGGGTGGAGDQGGAGGAAEVTYTPEQQAKIDEIVSARVAETKRTTAQTTAADVAKQLGVTLDEAKTIIAEAKKKADDEKDEKTRREAAELERDQAKAAEKAVARDASIRIAVADATAGIEAKDDATRSAARADIAVLVANELGADKIDPSDEEVTAALTAVKGRHPALFATKKAASGDHSGGPRGGGGDQPTGLEAGKARAAKEREEREKGARAPAQPMTVLGAASN